MSANPVDLIGGLVNSSPVPKADITAWAKARVPQVLADATELRNTNLTAQLVITFKSTGGFYFQDTADTTSPDDGVSCIISLDGKRFKPTISSSNVTIAQPQCRITLTSGVAITTSDVAAATTIFLTAGQSPISDGVNITPNVSAQLSLVLDSNNAHAGYHQAGKNFDLFKFNDAGTIRFGSGPSWNSGAVPGSDTAPGTGAGSTDVSFLGNTGLQVNANAIALRWGNASGNVTTVPIGQAVYLGSFRPTADGQAEDSQAKRLVWNAFNQAPRVMRITDGTVSWNLVTTSAVRQMNGNSANQAAFLIGRGAAPVQAELIGAMTSSTATVRTMDIGIGVDNIVAFSQSNTVLAASSAYFTTAINKYRGSPGQGYHFLAALENGAGSDTQTVFGSPYMQLVGEVWG